MSLTHSPAGTARRASTLPDEAKNSTPKDYYIPAQYTLANLPLSPVRRLPILTAGRTKREVARLLTDDQFAAADHLYSLIQHCYPHADYALLRNAEWTRCRTHKIGELTRLLEKNQFDQADQAAKLMMEVITIEEYATLRIPHWTRYQSACEEKIIALLVIYEFEKADSLAEKFNRIVTAASYTALRAHYWEKRRAELYAHLDKLCMAYQFKQADEFARRAVAFIPISTYQRVKLLAVQQYFRDYFNHPVNEEQAAALAASDRHILLKARAGSGKTRTIVCKAAFVMEQERLQSDQIMLLAFNKKAALEMAKRLQGDFGYKQFVTALTFHSLAYQIVRPKQEIVYELAQEQVFEQAMGRAMGSIYHLLKEARGADLLDLSEEATLTADEYLSHRRDLAMITLSGVTVKSWGEKWIADYLFEHDIPFIYEKTSYLDGYPSHPDFTLPLPNDRYVILEHWGVSTREHNDALIFGGPMRARDYRSQMDEKRARWKKHNVPLIESSIDEMRAGRASFEAELARKLARCGIIGRRLTTDELQEKLTSIHLKPQEEMLLNFINHAKSRRIRPSELFHRVEASKQGNRSSRFFWQLAAYTYAAYEEALIALNKIDFHNLLEQAAEIVESTSGKCSIAPGRKRTIWLNQLRWLLVDEFQDFSPSFDHFITTIRRHNPELNVFCVGDDWQAINGFAGSDLVYFRSFTQGIPGAVEMLLRTNHRSQKAIVDIGNQLMANLGPAATSLPTNSTGQIQLHCLDKLPLDAEGVDRRFCPAKPKFNDERAIRFIKLCWQVLREIDTEKKIVILSRKRKLYSLQLAELRYEILRHLDSSYKDRLEISTVHSYKGLEADIAILVDVTDDSFPMIHSNIDLRTPLYPKGIDLYERALAEERRLFYVALTRAKESVWILTESGRVSPFLNELGLKPEPFALTTPLPIRSQRVVELQR